MTIISRLKPLRHFLVAASVLLGTAACDNEPAAERPNQVLVFSKTAGFYHASIPQGIALVQALGQEHDFGVDTTTNAANFTEENLKNYAAVVFMNTTGDVLNAEQQADFERYIQAGGGFVGVHSATDTEYDWPWYGKLVGAYFNGHPNNPNVQDGMVDVVDKNFEGMGNFPDRWEHADEFYNFKNINPDIKPLLKMDESSYNGGTNGDDHPMAWYHEYDGGRAFYTNFGHTDETYAEPLYKEHFWGGLHWAMGGEQAPALNYEQVKSERVPAENRFEREMLAQGLNEPIAMEILPDDRIVIIERRGDIKMYHPDTKKISVIAHIPVFNGKYRDNRDAEEGLLGIALSPNYAQDHYVYLYYAPEGGAARNVLARYTLEGDNLDMNSKVEMLEVKTQRDECCHTGGSIAFDAQGNLYLSTGDNTNPFDSKSMKYNSNGYGPMNGTPGREAWDARRSSANTMDLRGKVIRIHPEADGSYTIPDGNLFPKDAKDARPEIYTMGHRNPYKISVDQKNGYLYWGDVGPDASTDSTGRGPRGYDELNQARKPGFFGWPMFVGNNRPYNHYDYQTGESGEPYDPKKPINDSPNNTGRKELPPVSPAFLYYPYAESPEFPIVGKGGRNAMAGPVFYSDLYQHTEGTFPAYFDGKLFGYDWIRGWVLIVTMDDEGNLEKLEPFMGSTKFNNPVDMKFDKNGTLYVLEYGNPRWFAANDNSGLSHIRYNAGNRTPVLAMSADKTVGAAPLTVQFNSEGTKDYDQDDLTYEWYFGSSNVASTEPNPSHTFDKPGVYKAMLQVTDAQGATATMEKEIMVGNARPEVTITVPNGNQTFYWDNRSLAYDVQVADKEDGTLADGKINPEDVYVTVNYLPDGYQPVAEGEQEEEALGHEAMMAQSQFAVGKRLLEGSDCRACHSNDQKSVGPAYLEVAKKYDDSEQAITLLANKIIKGGSGVWGEQAMPAHPQLSVSDASQIVRYIFSLDQQDNAMAPSKPAKGTLVLNDHQKRGNAATGDYVISATYTDKGANQITPLTGSNQLILRNPKLKAASADGPDNLFLYDVPGIGQIVVGMGGGYMVFKDIDLTDVNGITVGVSAPAEQTKGGDLELHLDKPDSPAIVKATVSTTEQMGMQQVNLPLSGQSGKHDLYFSFVGPAGQGLYAVSTVEFKVGTGNTTAMR
ncbi:cytochrome c [Catalinimonas alkaloidigena]|uniref:Cytochrome c n=1 Tax=Catalinimonas alkaloidigena TaxID=1075417 RepID=A0A1G9A811_9BACT|nr:ThuA domain-containing protein [Catalinimonas alkaloidigena]SDK22954.1 cytochrome c [Catalinimonas alkaloidigena]